MNENLTAKIRSSLDRFVTWFQSYGETSYDHQSYFASSLGRRAKAFYYRKPFLGIVAVSPMILSEACLPSARRFFWHRQRLPIADAHYAMGFALLSRIMNNGEYYDKAVHFLEVLKQTRCLTYEHYCWGYPFHWETRNGTITEGTPLITTTPYVYEAFSEVYDLDKKNEWYDIMMSIAEHARIDIKDFEVSPGATSCSYTPDDTGGVINASAYRALLLTAASLRFSNEHYWQVAKRNINFVLQYQLSNGSWPYSIDGTRDFIDHFHTCFVLKALAKIELLTGHDGCRKAIDKGIEYYVKNLFDDHGLPKPFAKSPRLTVYKNELYDYAECVNLGVLLKGRCAELDKMVGNTLLDVLSRWQRPDGSFRSRKLFVGWDNVPMHRWGQSQMFRALCSYMASENYDAS